MRRLLLAILALGMIGLVGCGKDKQTQSTQAAPAGSGGSFVSQAAGDSTGQDLNVSRGAYTKSYPAAGFEIYWPSGCGIIGSREPEDKGDGKERDFSFTCDRNNEKGYGYGVYAALNARRADGSPPDPRLVVSRVQMVLQNYGVEVQRQRTLKSNGIEGVEVQATEPEGPGEVWVRGLLSGPNFYILSAWNKDGQLFDDPEAKSFFASFRLVH